MTLHWFHSLTRHNFHFPISHFCFEKICFLPQVLHHHNKSPAHYQVQVRIWLFGWCEQFLSKCLQPRWWEMTKWRFYQSPRSLIEDTGRRCCLNLNWSTCHLSCIISLVLCAKSGLASSMKMPHIRCQSPLVTIIRSTSHTFLWLLIWTQAPERVRREGGEEAGGGGVGAGHPQRPHSHFQMPSYTW